MDTEQFREHGKNMIDWICDYNKTIADRQCAPTIEPGFMKKLLPTDVPELGEDFNVIAKDFDDKIMQGILNWNHPKFFAYFSSSNSYPSILGTMIDTAMGAIGFSWASNPAATELETIMLSWYARMLDLPAQFLSDTPGSKGGCAMQGSASDCAFVCLMTARDRAIKQLKANGKEDVHDSVFLPQLVAYSSKEAHSSVEKAAKMALVQLRILEVDSHGSFRGPTLKAAIENDVKLGLTPFFVVGTCGTTGSVAFDHLTELGVVCKEYNSIWFHVDGAYGGNSFILPEMRYLKQGLEYANSFNVNPYKKLLVSFESSCLWVSDVMALKSAFIVNPLYLQHEFATIDYRNYGIPLSRGFKALKLWFVFRTYGVAGLQKYLRSHIKLAKYFESLIRSDDRFEVCNDTLFGLCCFRIKGADSINRELLARINHTGKFHLTPAMVNNKYTIRFCVTYEHAVSSHIDDAWEEIKLITEEILEAPTSGDLPNVVKPAKKKLTRTMSARFSFTRSVSKEIYERQNSRGGLKDGCTPIIVLDHEEILDSLHTASKNYKDSTDEASN